MESPWTWAVAAMALIAMAFSYGVPHAWRWIGLMMAIFFATTVYVDYGDHPEFHPFLALLCDAAIATAVMIYYREDWELGIAIAFMASCFTSLLRIFHFIPDTWLYPSLLELCNAGALLCITGTGIVDMVGRRDGSAFHSLRVRLHSPRSSL